MVATCLKWFPDKRGFINGLSVLGFGLGGMLFTPIARLLIVSFGIMNAFLFLGIIFLFSVVLGAQVLKIPPENYKPEGWIPPSSSNSGNLSHDKSYRDLLKTSQFKILWITHFIGITAGLMIIMNITNIWESFAILNSHSPGNYIPYDIYRDILNKGIMAVTIVSIFNAFGRIVWGKISDKIGRESTLILIFFLYGIVLLSLNFSNTFYFFLCGVSLVGLCYGGLPALYPAVLADYYGTKNLGTNYALIYTSFFLSGFLGPYLAPKLMIIKESVLFQTLGKNNEIILNTYDAGSYIYSFEIAGIMCIIAAALLIMLKRMGK